MINKIIKFPLFNNRNLSKNKGDDCNKHENLSFFICQNLNRGTLSGFVHTLALNTVLQYSQCFEKKAT